MKFQFNTYERAMDYGRHLDAIGVAWFSYSQLDETLKTLKTVYVVEVR